MFGMKEASWSAVVGFVSLPLLHASHVILISELQNPFNAARMLSYNF